MQNAHFESGDISSLLPKLPTQELEFFLKEIKTIIRQRENPTKKEEEASLIERLNETVLPEKNFKRHTFLVKKQRSEGLSETEKKEMEQLISEDQLLQVNRIHILGRLAQLRKITIPELLNQLGIQPPESV